MFRTLIKIRLRALGNSFSGSGSKKGNTAGRKVLFALLAVYVSAALLFMFGGMFSQMAIPMHEAGLDWLYFAYVGLMSFILMVVGSVFSAKAQLYEARDNELLLSMPVPPGTILASRMGLLLILNFVFELMVVLPAGVVYALQVPVSAGGVIRYIVLCLLLPLLAMAVSCLFGGLLALVSGRVRRKALVTTVISAAFLVAYFYFVSQMNRYVEELILNAVNTAGALSAVAPLYWFGRAAADGNIGMLLATVAITVIPFGLVYWLLSATFDRIISTKKGFAKIQYHEKELKTSTADAALLRKEFKRFVSCPAYMINAGLGVLFLVAAGVMILIKRDAVLQMEQYLPGISAYYAPIAVLAMGMCNSMITISSVSVSLEGKTLWILHTMPVPAVHILRAKVRVQALLAVPVTVFASVCVAIALNLNVVDTVLVAVASGIFAALTALFGLICNLLLPKLDWMSETQVVKQGVSVIAAMFGTFAIVVLIGVGWFFGLSRFISSTAALGIMAALFAMLTVLAEIWLQKRGVERFARIGG